MIAATGDGARRASSIGGGFVVAALAVLALALLTARPALAQGGAGGDDVAIAIHGGAGTILPGDMTDEREAEYRAALEEALRTGHGVLSDGGGALDAVVEAIQTMEASPLFNAGRGAVFTSEGTVELDASIMDGRTRNSGAITGVKTVRSPIALAREVMESSVHVMMAGRGAETFAESRGLEQVENSHFYTERRRQQLEEARSEDSGGDADGDGAEPEHELGTVGVVALDRDGDLAAGTSTGGMTNKRFGRVGDSPIIGAGTYAENGTAAISATGHGEFFIRGVVSHDVAAMMRYTGLSVTEAANAVIHGKLTEMGATGGIIALDASGNVAMPFNTPGMYRGRIGTDGELVVEIYRD